MTEENVPHIRINGDTISLTLRGRPFTIGIDHPNFNAISDLLNEDAPSVDALLALVDKAAAIRAKFSTDGEHNITVRAGQVFYKDLPVHNALTKRIIEFTDKHMPTRPLIRFLENMMQNPSHRAVKELYDFLEHKGMAITTDGHFLAYKGVTTDFKDKHTRTIDNSVGTVVEVERNMVDDDRDNQCSNGLHVGHYEYARGFAYGGEPVLLVKVNPRDAVSVPTDSNCGKLRTCRYEVLRVYEGPDQLEETPGEELPDSLYDPQGQDLAKDGGYANLGEGNCGEGGCGSYDGTEDDDDGYEQGQPNYYDDEDDEDDEDEIEIEIDLSPEDLVDDDDSESRQDRLDELTTVYMTDWDRDNLCRHAADRGIFPTVESARRAGKALVAEACATDDLD